MTIKKKETMSHHGIRFTAEQWRQLSAIAKRERCTPSDVVRHAVEQFIQESKNVKA